MNTESETNNISEGDSQKWEDLRVKLVEARDSHDGEWLGRDEIQEAMREANLDGVSPNLVIACDLACESHKEFARAVIRGQARQWKILCVDDEPGFTKLLKANLERKGRYEVREENNPANALASMIHFQPDLVLLDLIMPGTDGSQLLELIRGDENFRTTPVIVLSSLVSDIDDGDGGMTKDGVLYLSKPVQLKSLTHCLERLLYTSAQDELAGP